MLFQRFWRSNTQKSDDEVPQNIQIHNHIHRGWDHTHLKWQDVIWPQLDGKLQPTQGRSMAMFRLDWSDSGKAEDDNMDDSQGSLTPAEIHPRPSIAGRELTEGPRTSGLVAEPDKSKAKEAARSMEEE